MKRVAIIGAGAAGLACAATIIKLNPKIEVVLIDKNNSLGKKLLVTGNGRCNISNDDMRQQYYHGNGFERFYPLIHDFNVREFFSDLGMITTNIDTFVYPYTKQATTVVDAFKSMIRNIEVKTGFEVIDIIFDKSYLIKSQDNVVEVDYVVIATGGKAYVKKEYNGYALLEKLGHTLTSINPSLVQIKTKEVYKELKGSRLSCTVSFVNNNIELRREVGEVMFTDYGLTGIAIMQCSRLVHQYPQSKIVIDCMPEYEYSQLVELLEGRKIKFNTIEDYCNGLILKPLMKIFINKLNIAEVCDIAPDSLAKMIKEFTLHVIGTQTFENSQVCAGGVSLEEIDNDFMSRLYDNMFIIGEVLDIDGDCGGYNLHYAFASGYHVGRRIAND